MTTDRARLADAYDRSGTAWEAGPARVYEHNAHVAIGCAATDLSGLLVLDIGAGTGAASRVIRRMGGTPIAVDMSAGMLAAGSHELALLADARLLPLRESSVDASIAAFCFNHLDAPSVAMREAARVTRPGGPVIATAYKSGGVLHPVKDIFAEIASEHGWVSPPWYDDFYENVIQILGSAESFAAAAQDAGLNAAIHELTVSFDHLSPRDLVEWRAGTADIAPFLASLPDAERRAMIDQAVEELGDCAPLQRTILVMVARAS